MSLVEHYSAHHTHQMYSPTVIHTWQIFLVPRDSSVPEFLKKSRSWQMVTSKPWPQDFGEKRGLRGVMADPKGVGRASDREMRSGKGHISHGKEDCHKTKGDIVGKTFR